MPTLKIAADRRRLLFDVLVFGPDPTIFDGISAKALIDTGATVSGIGPRIIAALGLRSYGKNRLGSATEERLVDYYLFRIGIPSMPLDDRPAWPHTFDRIDGFSWARNTDFDVILGMDILMDCDLQLMRGGICLLGFGDVRGEFTASSI